MNQFFCTLLQAILLSHSLQSKYLKFEFHDQPEFVHIIIDLIQATIISCNLNSLESFRVGYHSITNYKLLLFYIDYSFCKVLLSNVGNLSDHDWTMVFSWWYLVVCWIGNYLHSLHKLFFFFDYPYYTLSLGSILRSSFKSSDSSPVDSLRVLRHINGVPETSNLSPCMISSVIINNTLTRLNMLPH